MADNLTACLRGAAKVKTGCEKTILGLRHVDVNRSWFHLFAGDFNLLKPSGYFTYRQV
jgi:hypothetical protein